MILLTIDTVTFITSQNIVASTGDDNVLYVLALIIIYLIPTIIAFSRGTLNKVWVFWINLLLAWTGVAWIVTLILALSGKTEQTQIKEFALAASMNGSDHKPQVASVSDELEKLSALKTQGLLTDDEFETQKQNLLKS